MISGEVRRVDFGIPHGSQPGFERPAIVLTSDIVLDQEPRTVHVVPLTTNVRRGMPTEVPVDLEELQPSAAQCHLLTVVSIGRLREGTLAVVGEATLAQIRSVVGDLLDVG